MPALFALEAMRIFHNNEASAPEAQSRFAVPAAKNGEALLLSFHGAFDELPFLTYFMLKAYCEDVFSFFANPCARYLINMLFL